MGWQAIRAFPIGDKTCESTCGHFHTTPEAAARCGYRTWPHSNTSLARFTEIVLFVGKGSSGYHAGDEMECRVTEDGHITLTAIKPPEDHP